MNRFPIAYTAAAELVPMFRGVLEQCNLRSGELLLLHTDTTFNPHYPAACLAAGLELGAHVYQLTVPSRNRQIELEDSVVRAWREADMVIDLVSAGAHLFSPLNTLALEAGTRVLRVAEPVDSLERMLPDPEVRQRSEAGARLLSQGSRLRLASPAGTRLSLDIRGRHGVAQHGLADEPGRWDHWPSGLSLVAPIENSAVGRIVAGLGDVIFTFGRYVAEPIECTIESGRVTSITGGVDAFLLREWLAAQHSACANVVGLIAWGTDHRARWDRVAWHLQEAAGVMDTESYYGNVRIGLGATTLRCCGEQTTARLTSIYSCAAGDVWVDDRLVVQAGEFTDLEWRTRTAASDR